MRSFVRLARSIGGASISLLAFASCNSSTAATLSPGGLTHPTGNTVTQTPEAGRPFGIAVSGAGVVLVTELDNDELGQYLLPSQTLDPTAISVGRFPTDVTILPDGSKAFVSNQLAANIGFVGVSARTQTDTVTSLGTSFRVLAAPDGNSVWFTTNIGGLFVLNPTNKQVSVIVLDGPPNGIAFNPTTARVYVSTMTGMLYAINTSTHAVVAEVRIPGTLQQIAVSPDGSKLYVANETGPLAVLDATSLGGIANVSAAANAFSVAITPDGAQLYVSQSSGGQIQVLDATTYAVTKTITGGIPRRIAFDATGATAMIANEAGWVTFVK